MTTKKPDYHPFTHVGGRHQSTVLAVSFTDQHQKRWFILGRGDPRYHDQTAECLTKAENGLPVGNLKFIAGMMENGPSQMRPWLCSFPSLKQSVGAISRANDISPEFAEKMANNAFKEMGEEMGLTCHNMSSWLKKPTLHYLHLDDDGRKFHGNPMDVHFLHLDLGQLGPKAIKLLNNAIAPGDDTIQSLVVCEDDLAFDAQGKMFTHLHTGKTKTKSAFDGFPEMDEWLARMEDFTDRTISARVAGVGDAGKHKITLGSHHAYRGHLEAIHTQVRGLEGIDRSTLHTGEPIPIMSSNARIIQAICAAPLKTHDWALEPPTRMAHR